jgi:hypothetical protein
MLHVSAPLRLRLQLTKRSTYFTSDSNPLGACLQVLKSTAGYTLAVNNHGVDTRPAKTCAFGQTSFNPSGRTDGRYGKICTGQFTRDLQYSAASYGYLRTHRG